MELNGEASGGSEVIKDPLEASDSEAGSTDQDKSIIRILKDGTWEIRSEAVGEVSGGTRMPNKLLPLP